MKTPTMTLNGLSLAMHCECQAGRLLRNVSKVLDLELVIGKARRPTRTHDSGSWTRPDPVTCSVLDWYRSH